MKEPMQGFHHRGHHRGHHGGPPFHGDFPRPEGPPPDGHFRGHDWRRGFGPHHHHHPHPPWHHWPHEYWNRPPGHPVWNPEEKMHQQPDKNEFYPPPYYFQI